MLIGRLIYETLCATEVLASFRRCNGLFLLARLCSLGELSHAQKELQVFRPKPTGTSDELSAGHIAQRRAVERAFIATDKHLLLARWRLMGFVCVIVLCGTETHI